MSRPDQVQWLCLAVLSLACGLSGCGPTEVETTYGRSRGKSINGTNVLAELFRERGDQVRVAIRYNETLGDWAKVLVRFAPYPGPPSRSEAEWLSDWLGARPGRKLVYIPQDYHAAPEFWAQMLAALPSTAPGTERSKIESRRSEGLKWPTELPSKSKHPATGDLWFGTEAADPKKPDEVTVCRELGGPWATGVDPAAAALPRRESLRAENDEDVLLTGDGKKLVVGWSLRGDDEDGSAVIVVANGSFLVNGGLLNKARRLLATRVLDWVGRGAVNVAFVEGSSVLADLDDPARTSPWHLLTVEPFNWVAAHLAVFGALLCLSVAVRIGRPRPEPASEIERPSAHPIALGAILARTRQMEIAQDLIKNYRRWRHPSSAPRIEPTSSSSRRVPRA